MKHSLAVEIQNPTGNIPYPTSEDHIPVQTDPIPVTCCTPADGKTGFMTVHCRCHIVFRITIIQQTLNKMIHHLRERMSIYIPRLFHTCIHCEKFLLLLKTTQIEFIIEDRTTIAAAEPLGLKSISMVGLPERSTYCVMI